ncbi:hypothetical protein PJL18_03743 [Paenarthrobacter nicotinovorans]|nr:hypothetical protein [Paenarthrobacter nicotinovorans]
MAGGCVLDEVRQWLGYLGGRVLAKESQQRLRVLSGVEGPADGDGRETVDRRRPLAFGVGHQQQRLAELRSQVARGDGRQVGLQEDVVDGGRQMLAKDGDGLLRLGIGNG